MPNPLKPLVRAGSYRSLPFGFVGAFATIVPFPFALIVAMLSPDAISTGMLAMAVLIALAGLPGPVRRFSIALANGMLGTRLTPPERGMPIAWADRLRTSAWLLVHTVLGGLLMAVAGFLLAMIFLPVLWLTDNGGYFTYFGLTVKSGGGIGGLWTVGVALVHLTVLGYVSAGATALYKLAASALLDPSAAERAAAAERHASLLAQRNRLARELHDSIGHTLTTSTIQAAAAAELVDADPELVRRALGTIEESSRTALEDLDHVLGLLREDPASTAPQRTLSDAATLVSHARASGAEVELVTSGAVDALPATISREAYRIVQEGLTNALRHAHPGPVAVRIAVDEGELRLEVTNPLHDNESARPGRIGHGLAGLSERVEVLRGELTAGMAGADWRLAVRIPLRPGS